jgi:myosin light chain 6
MASKGKAAPAPAAKAAPAPAAPPPAEKKEEKPTGPQPPSAVGLPALTQTEMDDAREVFDLFDFWDGRDGVVEAAKVGDVIRCLNLNPTLDSIYKNGGAKKMGERQYKFEEFLPIYQSILKEKDTGTFADFNEAFKTFDREGQGYISAAEMRHVLRSLGEQLTEEQVDNIFKACDVQIDNDGNMKYEDFIKKVMDSTTEK